MARPTKAPQERREDRLNARFTSAERVVLEEHAAALGLSPTEFMRRRALGYRMPPVASEQRETARLATALIRIGVNLNQLTHHANAGREPHEDILAELTARIHACLDGIYDAGPYGVRT